VTLNKYIGTHAWLFAGLSGLPICVIIVVLVYFMIFGTPPSQPPSWGWYASCLCLLVLVAVIGFVVACCLLLLLEWRYWPLPKSWTRACLIVFTVTWSIVFGCLSLWGFGMGVSDSPQPTSVQEFINNLFIHICIPCLALSQAISMSLLASTGLTVILVALARAIAWCASLINSTNK